MYWPNSSARVKKNEPEVDKSPKNFVYWYFSTRFFIHFHNILVANQVETLKLCMCILHSSIELSYYICYHRSLVRGVEKLTRSLEKFKKWRLLVNQRLVFTLTSWPSILTFDLWVYHECWPLSLTLRADLLHMTLTLRFYPRSPSKKWPFRTFFW